MIETLHFTLGEGIDDLVRQAYWFENRKEWAMSILKCLRGITEAQKMAVLEGNARLIPTEGGKRLKLVFRPDEKFKKKLVKHEEWRKEHFYNLAGHFVSKSAVNRYSEFVVRRYRMTLFRPQFFIGRPELVLRMEQIRQFLHDIIVNETPFKGRKGEGYNQFEVAIGKFVDAEAEKFGQSFDRGEFRREGIYTHASFIRALKEEFGDWENWACDICDKKLFMITEERCGSCGRFVCAKCYDYKKDSCIDCTGQRHADREAREKKWRTPKK